eukprot:108792-Amphidinium_carterae.1
MELRSREMTTSKLALKSTRRRHPLLQQVTAASTDYPDRDKDKRYANMVCKFLPPTMVVSQCKKGKSCEAKHVPKDKGCTSCGSPHRES